MGTFIFMVGTFVITCGMGGCYESSYNAMKTAISVGSVELLFEIYGLAWIYKLKDKK